LGGSFNPVHRGHIALAETARKKLDCSLVILVPAWISPFKVKDSAGGTDALAQEAERRLLLLLAAVEGRRGLVVDDCEVQRGGVSWTIDTVDDIIRRYEPDGKPALLLGEDLLADFPQWKNAAELAEQCSLVVARRQTESAQGNTPQGDAAQNGANIAGFPYPYTLLDNPLMPVSSSLVREKIARNEDSTALLPIPVLARSDGERVIMRQETAARETLPAGRFIHSRNTAILAARLARRFGLDEDTAYLAGIAHDIAKTISTPLGHGEAGAALLEKKYGIDDPQVLEAVRVHTEGKTGMGTIAKVVYIADKVEWRRRTVAPGLRRLLETLPLDELLAVIMQEVHAYLRKKGIEPGDAARELLESFNPKGKTQGAI
jgi:nicotinate-nucleotide adenylyltransferase